MLYKALSVLTFSLPLLFAGKGIAAEKRRAESHVHGVAEINIIVEGKRVVVEFHAPAESVMGFEHEAKSDVEKKKRDAAIKRINDRFNELVVFDKKFGCQSQAGKVTIVQSDSSDGKDKKQGQGDHKKGAEHRELRATHNFECQKDPTGSRVRFGVTKVFPEIQEIKVQVLSDDKQSGATIKKDKGDVGL
jgi:Protein of unknown function (DUF2796)